MKKLSLVIAFFFLLCSFTYSGCKTGQNNRTAYDIEISLDGKTVYGKQTVTYYNGTETSLKELKFNLFANAFRQGAAFSPVSAGHVAQSYYCGVNYGNMVINEVKSGGRDLEFEICGQDANILSVKLNEELFPEEKVEVFIDFTVNLANVISRTGVNENTINLANFYPILCARCEHGFYECVYYSSGDPFYSDCADYKVKIIADQKLVVAASGKLTETAVENGKTINCYSVKNARSFAFVLSENFSVLTEQVDDVEINYYYYNDAAPQDSMQYAVKSMNYFEKTFGEYPYSTYSVVQTEFVQGGMEFPGLVMISNGLDTRSYGEVIVHETAHQWWQSVVGNNEIEFGFLDEGLAEYSVVLFYENHPEYNLSRQVLIKSAEETFKVFCTVSDKLFGKVDTSMLRSLKDFKSEYEYVNMAYIKPCIMYDTLRTTLGEDRFFKGLKRYYETYKFKNVVPDDLVGVFEKIGADSNGFFQSFFDGTAII